MKNTLLSWLPAAAPTDHSMDVDPTPTPSKTATPEPVPEGEIYLRLLIIHNLHKSPDTYKKSIELSHETVDKMQALNRRSMDPIAAKLWYALERSYELGGELADARPYVAFYNFLQLPHNDVVIDASWPPNALRLCVTTMKPRHPSSTGSYAAMSSIACMTKPTSSFPKPLSPLLQVIPSLPAITTTWAASKPCN